MDAWLQFTTLELLVVTLSGREVAQLKLSGDSTVLVAKKLLAPKLGLSRYQVRLIFDNESLDDGVVLGSMLGEGQSEPLQVTVIEMPYSWDSTAIQQLIGAAKMGKLRELEESLQVPVFPDAEYGEGIARTAMQFAAMNNQVAVIQLLYEAGASLNNGTTTPLLLAVWASNANPAPQAVQVLCNLGADTEKMPPVSEDHPRDEVVIVGELGPPLVAAVCLRRSGEAKVSIVRSLLDAGADVNRTLPDGKPLLWEPLLRGGPANLDVADALLAGGAAPVPISLMCQLCWENGNFMPCIIVLLGLSMVFDVETTGQCARATVAAIVGLLPGAIAAGLVWVLSRMLSQTSLSDNGDLLTFPSGILATCFASIAIAFQLVAASDFVHCWAKQSTMWNIATLPAMLPVVMPVLGAVCICMYFICLCIQLLFGKGPDDVDDWWDLRYKGIAGICMISVSIILGWFMCPGLERLLDLKKVKLQLQSAILLLGIVIFVVGVSACNHFRSLRLLSHAGSSLAASCCGRGYRPSALRNLQESLLSA